ncbi:hypothetical protein F5X96DRAFT_687489 [Biscogniauxia mediterranea]|nr:hypothetical protein F5X96DRAFT_687489 [Biscogniauxia mediterranea]
MSATSNFPEVQVEHLIVPRYNQKPMPQENNPDAKAWIVKSRVEPNIPVKLWIRPEFHQELQLMYPKIPGVDDLYRPRGLVNGQPMTDIAMKISTFAGKARPKILYRVVHAGQPHYGMKARGYGIVSVDPLYFQVLVQKHICWRCRNPSPFMSVTDDLGTVEMICKCYQERNFTGIKVITFRSSGLGWNHKIQRLWRCRDLGRQLHLSQCRLLEDTIPKYETESRSQPMIEQELGGNRKRKRELDETDEAEEEFKHPDENQTQEGVNDNSEVGSDAKDDTVMVKRRLVSKPTTDFKLQI